MAHVNAVGGRESVRIALDGGSCSERAVSSAVRFAQAVFPNLELVIYGPESLKSAMASRFFDASRLEYVPAAQRCAQDPSLPLSALIRRSARSSLCAALRDLKSGRVQAAVSAADLRSVCVLSRHALQSLELPKKLASFRRTSSARILRGRARPALARKITSRTGSPALLLDAGAVPAASAASLFDAACLGCACAASLFSLSSPRLAVMACAESELHEEVSSLISEAACFDFVGRIGPERLFAGDADVILSDAVTSSSALAAASGLADLLFDSGAAKVLSRIVRPSWYNDCRCGGALLLGLESCVVRADLSSGDESLAVALADAARAALSFESDAFSLYLEKLLQP